MFGKFSKINEDTLEAFGNLNETALKSRVLDQKTKMLMCVAIAIATCCEYCISARIAKVVRADAMREELIETASIGLLMGGSLAIGPIVTLLIDTINMLLKDPVNSKG